MAQSENDTRELERKIEQATRIGYRITDQTTLQRLGQFIEDLRQKLQQRRAARHAKEEIKARAWELWDKNGRPEGRDLEFWLQAETEISERE
jgi:hypothetical protein